MSTPDAVRASFDVLLDKSHRRFNKLQVRSVGPGLQHVGARRVWEWPSVSPCVGALELPPFALRSNCRLQPARLTT